MSMDGQGIKWRRNIAENFNRLSRVHERYRQTTGGRATDDEFTFAKNCCTVYYYSHNYVPTGYGTKRHSTVVYIRLYTDTIMYTEACVYRAYVFLCPKTSIFYYHHHHLFYSRQRTFCSTENTIKHPAGDGTQRLIT